MSTITVTNIQATGETASRAVSGVAAAWVNFNSTGTAAIDESFNFSTITDNGTGDHTLSLTNNMSSTNYCSYGSGQNSAATNIGTIFNNRTVAVGSLRVTYINEQVAFRDGAEQNAAIHGDLA